MSEKKLFEFDTKVGLTAEQDAERDHLLIRMLKKVEHEIYEGKEAFIIITESGMCTGGTMADTLTLVIRMLKNLPPQYLTLLTDFVNSPFFEK